MKDNISVKEMGDGFEAINETHAVYGKTIEEATFKLMDMQDDQ